VLTADFEKNEQKYYHDIVGIQGEFVFAEILKSKFETE
jgi:hypothetical protein